MAWSIFAPFAAATATLLSSALILFAMEIPVDAGLRALYLQPIADPWGWSELVLKATPLLLCAIGLCLCYRAGIWSIGSEGQFVAGALCAGSVALQATALGGLTLPLAIAAGVLGGVMLASCSAWLRTRFGASEVLTTIMLNYIAIGILGWSVHGPLRDPSGFSFPESALFDPAATLSPLWSEARWTIATPVALCIVLATGWFLARTLGGFQLRIQGLDQRAAAFAGFSSTGIVWLVMVTSGALAGFAGAAEVLGPIGQLTEHVALGYGYGAIIVAFIGRLHPIGIVFASMLLSLAYLGGENLQMETGVSRSVTALLQGLMLMYLLAFDGLHARYLARAG